ncbi:MAG: hypothetical protein MUE96_00145 [Bacteroidia bacterium]|nr:hypothetical protein [Bacteroidia bacterium]
MKHPSSFALLLGIHILFCSLFNSAFGQQTTLLKQKAINHSIGLTYSRHTDLLRVPTFGSGFVKPNHYYTYNAFKLFYELRYKNLVSLELGLMYLAKDGNYTYFYEEDGFENTINMQVARAVPPAFAHLKYHLKRPFKNVFLGVGIANNPNFYNSKTYVKSNNNTPAYLLQWNRPYLSIESLMLPLMVGKEFRFKKVTFDIRLTYLRHLQYRNEDLTSGIFNQISYQNGNTMLNQVRFVYDALQLGVSVVY